MTLTLGGSTMDILVYLFILTIQYIKVQRTFEIALSESWLALSIAYFYRFCPTYQEIGVVGPSEVRALPLGVAAGT